uniref:Uncharacterized protein n=1 Tax=Sphaerodactylus townsendi TaxID=933632 RepID=A0ACB8EMC5_9SAUR
MNTECRRGSLEICTFLSTRELTCFDSDQPYVSVAQQMAPPSPSGSNNNSSSSSSGPGGGGGGGDQLSKTNLYIRGLHPGTTDQDLVKLCQPYGKIVSTKAILDKTTNKCKGYGFVDFDSPTAAQKAVTALKASGVQAQMAKQQEQDPTNLYLSNLPLGMDEAELESMLKPFGQVISTRILRDASGTSRGVGFARVCCSKPVCYTQQRIPAANRPPQQYDLAWLTV